MEPHQALLQKLQQHPELAFSEAPQRLRIEAPDLGGFAVELQSDTNTWIVYLGNAGFHEAFFSAEEVMNFIAWCYSGKARIREIWRGPSPQRAVLEAFENGEWCELSLTGYFIWQYWRKRHEIILRNPNLLKG